MTQPRGIRNHNPLNIRENEISWKGQVIGTDVAFVTFSAPEYGIRAAARILQTYQEKYGISTLTGVIERWAPHPENDTSAYIASVSIWADIEPLEQLDLSSYDVVLPLLRAMTRMENGKPPGGKDAWYEPDVWERGLRLAGLSPSKSLTQSRTTKGAVTAAGGITTAVGILTDTLGIPEDIANMLPAALTALTDQAAAIVVLVIGLAGAGYTLYARNDDKLKGRL